MSIKQNKKLYDNLVHIGCGGAPNLDEYRALVSHIWLVDADTQVIAKLEEESRAFEGVNIIHALVDTVKRSGTFCRYSLPWANSLAPLDETIQQLYPGIRNLGSIQLLTTTIDELVTQCLPEYSGVNENSLLLLDVGCQNTSLLNSLEDSGRLTYFSMVVALPSHRRDRLTDVPYGFYESDRAPKGLTFPVKSQILQRHPLLQQLQHCQADKKKYLQALEETKRQLIDCRDKKEESEQRYVKLAKRLEEAHQKTENALHQNHLNWVAKNVAEARLQKLLNAQKKLLPKVKASDSLVEDGFYRAFEDRFRGTREEIKRRVSIYLPFVKPIAIRHPGMPALDLGCGRGEWLEVLQEAQIESEGVDQNAGMLENT